MQKAFVQYFLMLKKIVLYFLLAKHDVLYIAEHLITYYKRL